MEPERLQQNIKHLACLQETKDPVISCYVNLTIGDSPWSETLRNRLDSIIDGTVTTYNTPDLARSVSRIRAYLLSSDVRGARGIALFVREGSDPLWMPMKFSVPVPTWVSIDTVPNIYNLVELQDRYERYIVLLSTRYSARIFDIALGEVSKQVMVQRPTIRKRVRREWTRIHYQNHVKEGGQQFIREQVEVLKYLIAGSDTPCVILAGDNHLSRQTRAELPDSLASLVIDVVPIMSTASRDDIVSSTLHSFIAAQESESQNIVERLLNSFYKDDLAVLGVADCLQSLLRHQADVLIMKQDTDFGRAKICQACGWAVAGHPLPIECMECSSLLSLARDARTELVRLAEISGRPTETIGKSAQLDALGGVGCLLRYPLRHRRRPDYTEDRIGMM